MNTTEGTGGKLAGKLALITGGTSGIGLATAKRFVGEGAYVFVTGRREAELASAEREIGKNLSAIQGDNDLRNRQIRVNAISPGVTETQGFRDLINSPSASNIETQRRRAISSIPLGRLGTPDDIAKVVVFLASEDSGYIAGAEASVDGGFAQV